MQNHILEQFDVFQAISRICSNKHFNDNAFFSFCTRLLLKFEKENYSFLDVNTFLHDIYHIIEKHDNEKTLIDDIMSIDLYEKMLSNNFYTLFINAVKLKSDESQFLSDFENEYSKLVILDMKEIMKHDEDFTWSEVARVCKEIDNLTDPDVFIIQNDATFFHLQEVLEARCKKTIKNQEHLFKKHLLYYINNVIDFDYFFDEKSFIAHAVIKKDNENVIACSGEMVASPNPTYNHSLCSDCFNLLLNNVLELKK